jgi:hypothetical protein
MGLTQTLAARAGIRVYVHGGVELVSAPDVRSFLSECDSAAIKVLGVEAFSVEEHGIRPDMDAILDLSNVKDAAASRDETRAFLDAVWSRDAYYDFTLAR